MNIQINGRDVFVYGENIDSAMKSKIFQNWVASLHPDFNVEDIEFQSVDFSMDGSRVLFIKLRATVLDENGGELPGIVLLRGGSVAILVVLVCEGVEYTVLVRQPRLPNGNYPFSEIPAGMLDDSNNFVGVAIKELVEETEIELNQDNIVDLNDLVYGNSAKGVFSSVGITDEFIRYFVFRQTVSREYLDSLRNKLTGSKTENEKIVLEVILLKNLVAESPDSKSLCAFALYQRVKNRFT